MATSDLMIADYFDDSYWCTDKTEWPVALVTDQKWLSSQVMPYLRSRSIYATWDMDGPDSPLHLRQINKKMTLRFKTDVDKAIAILVLSGMTFEGGGRTQIISEVEN